MGEYEIAATMEDGNMAYILGSFKKRTSAGTVSPLAGAPDTVNNILTLANYSDSMKFRVGDIVSTGSTATIAISSIAGTKLYMSGSVSAILGTDQIRLAHDDTDIIGNAKNGATATVTDCTQSSQTVTLAANLCPISGNLGSGLIPYTLVQ